LANDPTTSNGIVRINNQHSINHKTDGTARLPRSSGVDAST
jgi:hypothetical protein